MRRILKHVGQHTSDRSALLRRTGAVEPIVGGVKSEAGGAREDLEVDDPPAVVAKCHRLDARIVRIVGNVRIRWSAPRIFGFRYKTGMSKLFRTCRAPLSQCAMT
jgi:hypothetical protein